MVDIEKLLDGKELILYTLVVNKKCLIRDFINCLEEPEKKQVANLLKQRADRFHIYNEQHFRPLGNEIFELKTRGGVRILCFWGGQRKLVLTHGFFKPPKKLLKKEIEKAIKWLKEYRDTRR